MRERGELAAAAEAYRAGLACEPDDAALDRVAREQFRLTDSKHLIASLGQGDIAIVDVPKALYPDLAQDV